MERGFYKLMDDSTWSYGTKVYNKDWVLTEETKDELGQPFEGYQWYESAPQAYLDWKEELRLESERYRSIGI